jgi:hypothetical protein
MKMSYARFVSAPHCKQLLAVSKQVNLFEPGLEGKTRSMQEKLPLPFMATHCADVWEGFNSIHLNVTFKSV